MTKKQEEEGEQCAEFSVGQQRLSISQGRGIPLRKAAQLCSSNYCISANAHEILTTGAAGHAKTLNAKEL